MAKNQAKLPKFLRPADPNKSKTGKPILASLSKAALTALRATAKPKQVSQIEKELAKRA